MIAPGRGPLPASEPALGLRVRTFVSTVLLPLLVLCGRCFDSHLGQGRCRGGQDLGGRAQLTRAMTFLVSQLRGTANPAQVPPVLTHMWAESYLGCNCSVTESQEGSYLLLVPPEQQRTGKAVPC